MRWPLRTVGLFVVTVLLSGCPKPWTVTVYNNTGEDLILALPSGDVAWKAGSKVKVVGAAATRKSGLHWVVDSQGNSVPLLRVKRSGSIVDYRGVNYIGLSGNFVDYEGSAIELWLQLEMDGLLHVVIPGSSFPARLLPSQPSGFPIESGSW
jgi:hypothetical protein